MSNHTKRMQQVANEFYVIWYEEAFTRGERGMFMIDRQQLRQLLGVQRLHSSTLEEFSSICFDMGLVMIDLDGDFTFVEYSALSDARRVPRRVVNRLLQALDGVEEEDEDEIIVPKRREPIDIEEEEEEEMP